MIDDDTNISRKKEYNSNLEIKMNKIKRKKATIGTTVIIKLITFAMDFF